MWERRREENRQRAIEERKCFDCGGFGHIGCHCRNIEEKELVQMLSNRFEVLRDMVMQREEESGNKVRKDRKMTLREERAKRRVKVQQTKVERKEKKENMLREVTMKIGLKQEKEEEGIVIEALLDSRATGLVISEKFARKHGFRRTKLERLIYVRNVDGTLNYTGPIVDTKKIEIFFKEHKKMTLINVIEGQKWGFISGMP